MSGPGCLTSDLRRCEASLQKDLVFIIGSGSSEFEKEIDAVKEVLGNLGFKGYFALLSQEEKGFEAFCTKICSKIIGSQFCVVMLHEPIEFSYLDKETKGEKIHRASRPNIYFEFGMAITLKKRIIPLIPDGVIPPFNVMHLDLVKYSSQDLEDLKKKLRHAVEATLKKPIRDEFIRKPDLILSLVDSEENSVEKICFSPTFIRIRKEKTKSSLKVTSSQRLITTLANVYNPFATKEPSEDLVPIRIRIANEGSLKAEGIQIFLHFPPDCELISKREFSSPLALTLKPPNPTSGGLFIDSDNKCVARAWIEALGNDLTMDKFDEIYVSFKPQEAEYTIKASVTQYNYPTEDFKFSISVKPKYKEEIEYIYEEPTPEDIDETILEKRIKEFGKEEGKKSN